jgi:NAD+ kinase
MIKFYFTFDKTIKAQSLKKVILKNNKNYSATKANIIVVSGGDGFMLNALKKYYKLKKPFYGINCGTFGFLMNKYSSSNIRNKIIKAKIIKINPLEVIAKTKDKKIKKLIAINEVSLFRQSRQTASLSLRVGGKKIIKKLIGDGVLISTPAGSTAYNLSVHGPILSLNSKKMAITPISPFRPRRWKGKIVSEKSTVFINNLNFKKRPLACVADNIELRNIRNLKVKINNKIKINLLYDRDRSLVQKIKLEQIRKNTK